MEKISDELIMAYVDGELEGEEAEQVRRALATDPLLRERAAVFEQTGRELGKLFDAPMHLEVPGELLDTVREDGGPSLFHRLGLLLEGFFHLEVVRPVPAAGFVVILVLGVILGTRFLLPPAVDFISSPERNPAFLQALEQSPGGTLLDLGKQGDGEGAGLLLVATFQDRSMRFCRAFEVTVSGGKNPGVAEGVACRNAGGNWSMVARVKEEESGKRPTGGNGYELAGCEDSLDGIIERLRSGPLLTPQQEEMLIRSGWKIGATTTGSSTFSVP